MVLICIQKQTFSSALFGWQGGYISDNIVAYSDNRDGHDNIYVYDILTQTESKIATGTGQRGNPAISGNYVVWNDERNGNYDIYGYDLSAKKEFPICTTPDFQYIPSISGNTVVWVGADGIYGAYSRPAIPFASRPRRLSFAKKKINNAIKNEGRKFGSCISRPFYLLYLVHFCGKSKTKPAILFISII